MDPADLNPIAHFEKLSRNQKVLVFGGAFAVAGYLYYHSKKKGEEAGEEGEEAPSGTGEGAGFSAEGNVAADEGMIPEGGEADPYLGGGYGGAAPADASNGSGIATPTSTTDGTVPEGGSTVSNTGPGAGGSGDTFNITGEHTGEASPPASEVTGGGAPATPHPAVAHLTSKHPAHKAAAKHTSTHTKTATHKTAKKQVKRKTTAHSQHTQHKATVKKHKAKAR